MLVDQRLVIQELKPGSIEDYASIELEATIF
jgi:hypothetical protein